MCVGDEEGVGAGALAHGSLGGKRGETAASVAIPHVSSDKLLKLRDRDVVNGQTKWAPLSYSLRDCHVDTLGSADGRVSGKEEGLEVSNDGIVVLLDFLESSGSVCLRIGVGYVKAYQSSIIC